MHAIASKLSPITDKLGGMLNELENNGIEVLETNCFKLFCYQSYTGVKFIVVAEPNFTDLEKICKSVYEKYSDYFSKNAFQQQDMHIRSILFDTEIDQVFRVSSSK